MPLYEYKCESCKIVNEIQHSIAESAPEKCPSCHQGPLRKLISKTGFVLKGNGWYSDGYSSKKPSAKESSADKAGQSPSDKSEKKESPAKPASPPAKAVNQ